MVNTVLPVPGAQAIIELVGTERVDVLAGAVGTTASTAAIADTAQVDQSVTSLGTNRATAYVLSKQITNITTAAASTGVVLPTTNKVGIRWYVFNSGASPVQVYAPGTATIDTVAGATGVPLTNAKRAIFLTVASNVWISAQLGVVSA